MAAAPAAQQRWRAYARTAAVLVAAVGAAAAPRVGRADTFANPIVPAGGDPFAFQWGGQYFYTATTGGDVKVARSPWLQSLNSNSRQVWNPPTDQPYGHNLWAPEIHRLDDKWYLYVAADDGADANHRMYVLEGDSQDPQGSYTLKGQISVPDHRWAIDGTVLEHGDKDYFVWSGRRFSTSDAGSDIGSTQSLYIAEMSNPWTLTGNRVRISSPQYAWETHGHSVNEGPQVLKHGDDVFLTYSASGFYTPEYAVGALKLTGSDPLLAGSWTKHNQPVFDQGNGVEGTGHASFVKSPDGTEDWIVYHARTAPGAARDVRTQPFTFGSNGLPQFGDPVPTGQPIAAPSGVPLVTFVPNGSFERGGAGWVDDFRAVGDAGVADNDGSAFEPITGGDGPRLGYLGVGTGADGAVYQDVGPLHAGTYTLSVGLAVTGADAALAAASPASVVLRLESIGLHAGGSANEADKFTLGELHVAGGEIGVGAFDFFDLNALAPDERVGTWLRVGIYAAGDLGGLGGWDVLLDHLTLAHSSLADSPAVPEPVGAASVVTVIVGVLLRRRPRESRQLRAADAP
jgi:GH43 family beta-xylosidase